MLVSSSVVWSKNRTQTSSLNSAGFHGKQILCNIAIRDRPKYFRDENKGVASDETKDKRIPLPQGGTAVEITAKLIST